MVNPEVREFLKRLPKCEQHLHIEGALTPLVLFRLAAKNGITLPTDDEAFASPESLHERCANFRNLDDFLHYYYIGMSVLVDASDFETLAWDYFEHASADGVHHAEVFFDPQAHLERGVPYEVLIAGFSAARKRAEAELKISSELICCFLRHLPAAACASTFDAPEVQRSFASGEVIGVGLDSSENGFPPEWFAEIYRKSKAMGLRRTAHAGEEGPSEYIRNALDHLDIERIDHGIRLAEDEDLLSRVAKEGKMLTVCPMSNVFLRCVSRVEDLPIRTFLEAGVAFSINSDDPAYFGNNYLLDNYVAVQQAFGLSVQDWRSICENSIRGSWCSETRKLNLLGQLQDTIKTWLAAHPEKDPLGC